MRVSIPLPRRCERRTLPIELIPRMILQKSNIITSLIYTYDDDWLAEWSKALVLGTSLSGGVGSNPTPVIFLNCHLEHCLLSEIWIYLIRIQLSHLKLNFIDVDSLVNLIRTLNSSEGCK